MDCIDAPAEDEDGGEEEFDTLRLLPGRHDDDRCDDERYDGLASPHAYTPPHAIDGLQRKTRLL